MLAVNTFGTLFQTKLEASVTVAVIVNLGAGSLILTVTVLVNNSVPN